MCSLSRMREEERDDFSITYSNEYNHYNFFSERTIDLMEENLSVKFVFPVKNNELREKERERESDRSML